jgi:hypothetical protein
MVTKIMKERERGADAVATTSVMSETVCPVCFNRRWVSEEDNTPWPVDPRSGSESRAAGMPWRASNNGMDQKPEYHPKGLATK